MSWAIDIYDGPFRPTFRFILPPQKYLYYYRMPRELVKGICPCLLSTVTRSAKFEVVRKAYEGKTRPRDREGGIISNLLARMTAHLGSLAAPVREVR